MFFKKFLNPRNDFAFKRIFGTEKNSYILIDFLNDALALKDSDTIKSVEFLKQSLDTPIIEYKSAYVDVICTDQRGQKYIIEMQVANEKHFENRALSYFSKVYSQQMMRGESYGTLKKTIFLAILNYTQFCESEFLSNFWITNKASGKNYFKNLQFCFIELPKFNKELKDCKQGLDQWCYFFKHAEEAESLENLIETTKVPVKGACQELSTVNWSVSDFQAYEDLEKTLTDNASALISAKESGLAEGLAKGKLEVAKNLIEQGIDLEMISKATGLLIEELRKIIE